MKSVKIIGLPQTDAPLWVREAWVGLTIPLDKRFQFPVYGLARSAVTLKALGLASRYFVNSRTAVYKLARSNPKAAKWWRERPWYPEATILGFDENICEVVEI